MRQRYWLFLVSVLLFVGGIGFIIAAERTRRTTVVPPAAVKAAAPTATVKQIMSGITGPAANVIFEAVSVEVSVEGTKEKAPQNDAEWAKVETSAALLVESANLLLDGPRAVDTGDWPKMAQQMAAAGQTALKAARSRKPDAILEVGEAVNMTCDNCHARYARNQ
jgi:hypothetical protein